MMMKYQNRYLFYIIQITLFQVYGEFLYIDATNNKIVKLIFPDLMYHRSKFATTSVTMGMS
jgi:hypothetical protein